MERFGIAINENDWHEVLNTEIFEGHKKGLGWLADKRRILDERGGRGGTPSCKAPTKNFGEGGIKCGASYLDENAACDEFGGLIFIMFSTWGTLIGRENDDESR